MGKRKEFLLTPVECKARMIQMEMPGPSRLRYVVQSLACVSAALIWGTLTEAGGEGWAGGWLGEG